MLSVSGHQATEHVILDEPVERGHNLVDCVLSAGDGAGDTPHLCGSPDILIIVVVIVGGVVEVELLGVVSVSNAKVAVFVIRKVAYLPFVKRGSLKLSTSRSEDVLRVEVVLGRVETIVAVRSCAVDSLDAP